MKERTRNVRSHSSCPPCFMYHSVNQPLSLSRVADYSNAVKVIQAPNLILLIRRVGAREPASL